MAKVIVRFYAPFVGFFDSSSRSNPTFASDKKSLIFPQGFQKFKTLPPLLEATLPHGFPSSKSVLIKETQESQLLEKLGFGLATTNVHAGPSSF